MNRGGSESCGGTVRSPDTADTSTDSVATRNATDVRRWFNCRVRPFANRRCVVAPRGARASNSRSNWPWVRYPTSARRQHDIGQVVHTRVPRRRLSSLLYGVVKPGTWVPAPFANRRRGIHTYAHNGYHVGRRFKGSGGSSIHTVTDGQQMTDISTDNFCGRSGAAGLLCVCVSA